MISAGYELIYPYALMSVGMGSNGSDGLTIATVGGFVVSSLFYIFISIGFAMGMVKNP